MEFLWLFVKWALIVAGCGVALIVVAMLYFGLLLVIQGKRTGGASLGQAWRELWWEVRPGFLKSDKPPVLKTPRGRDIQP